MATTIPPSRARRLPKGMRKRGKVYYAWFQKDGRRVQKRLSTNLKSAERMLNKLRSRVDEGDYGILDNDYPWNDLKAEFLRWVKQQRRVYRDYARSLRRFEEHAPIESIAEIDHDRVVRFRNARLDFVCPRTVNKDVATLSSMLSKAARWGRIGYNPIADLKPLRHETLRKDRRSLSCDEVVALLKAAPPAFLPVLRMFLTTGIRRSELVNMRFADVDFEHRTVTVQASTAKNHKARTIDLDDKVFAMIQRLQAEAPQRQEIPGRTERGRLSREHVFVTGANTPWHNNLLRTFYSVCKAAGIDGAESGGSVDLHALRVSFATLAIENGAPPNAVQAILGHSTLAFTMNVYARTTERAKRRAIGSLPYASVSAPEHVLTLERPTDVTTAETSSESAPQTAIKIG